MAAAGAYAIDWWSTYSTLEQRQELCRMFDWPTSYAEGEANEEWLTGPQLWRLKVATYEELARAESLAPESD